MRRAVERLWVIPPFFVLVLLRHPFDGRGVCTGASKVRDGEEWAFVRGGSTPQRTTAMFEFNLGVE